jgi:hypothetical protein
LDACAYARSERANGIRLPPSTATRRVERVPSVLTFGWELAEELSEATLISVS